MEAASSKTLYQTKVAAELWINLGGREYRLVGKTIRLGRASDNDIVLEDKSISRYHALISVATDQVLLEDLKSRNGVRVSGSKVKRSELKDGDEIQIGDLKGIFFQKTKQPSGGLNKLTIRPDEIEKGFSHLRSRFDALDKKKKIFVLAGIPVFFVFLLAVLGGGNQEPVVSSNQSLAEEMIRPGQADRRSFEACQELEDLGNFRLASRCFKAMPRTEDVHAALTRIQKRQEIETQKRFDEAKRAFDNYYFDVAVQKWQEVLLVADDDSLMFSEAIKGIEAAEARMRQR